MAVALVPVGVAAAHGRLAQVSYFWLPVVVVVDLIAIITAVPMAEADKQAITAATEYRPLQLRPDTPVAPVAVAVAVVTVAAVADGIHRAVIPVVVLMGRLIPVLLLEMGADSAAAAAATADVVAARVGAAGIAVVAAATQMDVQVEEGAHITAVLTKPILPVCRLVTGR